MRLLVLALLAVSVAGCFEEDRPSDDGVVPTMPLQRPDATFEALNAAGITMDGQAVVDEMRSFAATYPIRKANHEDHEMAREYLAGQYALLGLDVWRQPFENGIPQENICGIKWGANRDHWIVTGGHYDMTESPGAVPGTGTPVPQTGVSTGIYDDASGTIMTLHLAKALVDVPLDDTVIFCGFDGEERGLQGSGALADTLTSGATDINGESMNITITGMLDLDMFGMNWPGMDAPIFFDDNSPELQAFVRGYASQIGVPDDMIEFHGIQAGRSDYAHYFALGVPTGFYISDFEDWAAPADIPATGPEGTQYPFWHRADNWETMMLMAGSEEDVVAGFQTASDLALGTLYFLAADDDTVITGVEK